MKQHLHSLRALTAALVVAGAARAQDFNIDIGQTISTNPTGPHGAAAGQAGWWSWLQPIPGSTQFVQTLAAGASPVNIHIGGGVGPYAFNNPATLGQDERLMDDILDVGLPGAVVVWTIADLAPGGYWIYTYAWAPDNPNFRTRVHVDGSMDPDQDVGGPWPGEQRYLDTFALHFAVVSPGEDLVVRTMALVGSGSVNGFQIVTGGCDGRVHAYCQGKLNSFGCTPEIAGVGVPSVGAGFGFHVTAALVPPNTLGVLMYSITRPAETPFAGAAMCLGGQILRSPVQVSSPGGVCGGHFDMDVNAYAHAATAHPSLLTPGTTVWCQYIYRDAPHPDGSGIGLSDALRFTMCF
jgi:hypothetical protein